MTPIELKNEVESIGSERFFFSPDTMEFFGDVMSNYGVRDGGKIGCHWDVNGDNYSEIPKMIAVWELYRKEPVKYGLCSSAYFCKKTFRRLLKSQ